jgi:hypothetical protein
VGERIWNDWCSIVPGLGNITWVVPRAASRFWAIVKGGFRDDDDAKGQRG